MNRILSTAQTKLGPIITPEVVSMLIAVEDGLSQVEQALRQEGFKITKLTPGAMAAKVDAAVVTGMSNNFMGIEDTNGNRFPVIEASGKTAEEVIQQIRDRAGHK